MDQKKIGKFISEKRKEKKLTQEKLAEKLGVTDRAVSNWETGKSMPDLSLFVPLCEILEITINDLMSGEIVDDKEYINTLEQNIVSMVSNIEKKEKIKRKQRLILLSLFGLLLFIGYLFYVYYELNVKYDSRVMKCNFEDEQLVYRVNGVSVFNTEHIVKDVDGKSVYFFRNTINLYNKRHSNWEYSQSMAKLLDGAEIIYGSYNKIDINDEKIEVYYTNTPVNKIKKMDQLELKKLINESYFMCSTNDK